MPRPPVNPFDDDDDDPPISVRVPRQRSERGGGWMLMQVVWTILFLGVVLGAALYLMALGKAMSAVQEAAMSAMFAALVVAAYVAAKAIEGMAKPW